MFVRINRICHVRISNIRSTSLRTRGESEKSLIYTILINFIDGTNTEHQLLGADGKPITDYLGALKEYDRIVKEINV